MSKLYTPLNEMAFKRIDEPWKAYFLGWMYADGNIEGDLKRARIALQEGDRAVLDFFGEMMYGGKRPLTFCKAQKVNSPSTGKTYQGKPQWRFTLGTKSMVLDLVDKGLFPRKSLTLKFPSLDQVPEGMLPYFIRGVFEGDGMITERKGSTPSRVSILGSVSFIRGLSKYLKTHGIDSVTYVKGRIRNLHVLSREDVFRFYLLVYATDKPFVLRRKYDKIKRVYDGRFSNRVGAKRSQYREIGFLKRLDKWTARATVKGVRNWLGCFETEEAALEARKSFLIKEGAFC